MNAEKNQQNAPLDSFLGAKPFLPKASPSPQDFQDQFRSSGNRTSTTNTPGSTDAFSDHRLSQNSKPGMNLASTSFKPRYSNDAPLHNQFLPPGLESSPFPQADFQRKSNLSSQAQHNAYIPRGGGSFPAQNNQRLSDLSNPELYQQQQMMYQQPPMMQANQYSMPFQPSQPFYPQHNSMGYNYQAP